ncbi:uncharacterized protein BO96DRAFT_409871 [Aspergillus niger CBS 101883]|uniref:uncharacterized protein n=1 Tax=Aspergillus lacticoffeatus (strain CBS 101883) TaxID=1450533 RepID=UPI000D7EE605|nr:uncharacterized protein BO96DRAFT_409871 [Aspergillus niger CBS 101883]PYH59580.1 hypothetical protein BO96DRAFT_409871 [Aspergillus niger CBS 101883]
MPGCTDTGGFEAMSGYFGSCSEPDSMACASAQEGLNSTYWILYRWGVLGIGCTR